MESLRTPPLPHAYPCLLLDRILALRPGVEAVAVKHVTRSDPLVADAGFIPPFLLAEALAQCAGVAVLGERAGGVAHVARIDRFRSRSRVPAGCTLIIAARVIRIFGTAAKVRGVVRATGRVLAAGEVVLRIGKPSTEGTDVEG
jgi:3-hydroxyacyl-[acyl-carrier-protein] dehydratase